MSTFNTVLDVIQSNFKIGVESEISSNVMFLRISGIDNHSLAKYIMHNVKDLKVSVKNKLDYQFSDEWIKIEKNSNNELVLVD